MLHVVGIIVVTELNEIFFLVTEIFTKLPKPKILVLNHASNVMQKIFDLSFTGCLLRTRGRRQNRRRREWLQKQTDPHGTTEGAVRVATPQGPVALVSTGTATATAARHFLSIFSIFFRQTCRRFFFPPSFGFGLTINLSIYRLWTGKSLLGLLLLLLLLLLLFVVVVVVNKLLNK